MDTETVQAGGVSARILEQLRSMLTAERVFGAPIEEDGVTLIPAAAIRAGGGGGSGSGRDGGGDGESIGSGEGGGFGATARPVGAYVMAGGTVTWRPVIDLTRIVAMSAVVLVALTAAVASVRRAQARAA